MSNHAIVIKAPGDAQLIGASIPKLRDDYIIVKVEAVALNPTDILHIDYFASLGARVGCDYAGLVEEVGSKVTKHFKKGDRVAGFAHGSNAVNHEDGTFAEYITVKGDLQIHIPDNIGFEGAATLGVGVTTVGQALYQSLSLPGPDTPATVKFSVLIYGGSTATGALAIQFAKLSGLEVITTVSPHHFDYVRGLGVDAVSDYNSKTCVEDIKRRTVGRLRHAFDCISKESTAKICVGALSDEGGVYTTLLPIPAEVVAAINSHVTTKLTLAYSAIGEDFQFGQFIPANPDDFGFAKSFWVTAEKLLGEGKIRAHKPSVNEGGSGLCGVLTGLQFLREGKVSGKKLVYVL
ncbi:alcohol dehydrogenase class-3 [Zopfia rhizophila CBS 207.26]|uniref:Alcohol dehydrogenase class-3 n=1 Tax=Zopfia rhizophila CBS 207.26 TaxID=1314779 RepID=A0A6A6ESG7_9PEZI|nr:alcohol dehydrogenase class-3 [Zopfia rhizophila CBS 207.26]